MANYYQEALDLYGINNGFVDEQIDSIYELLKEKYDPDKFPFLSPEYIDASNKRYNIEMAYYTLSSCFRKYLVSKNSVEDFNRENLNEQILKLVYDYASSKKDIDEYFISNLVEIIVCNRNLNDYVKQISFEDYCKNVTATYMNNTLTIYFSNIYRNVKNSSLQEFGTLEKIYNPYCQVVSIIGHELEHANQRKIKDRNDLEDIKTRIILACESFADKMNMDMEIITEYPTFFYWMANIKMIFLAYLNWRKYDKNWLYSPKERWAEFSGTNLSLDLIQNLEKELAMPFTTLERYFMDSLESLAFDTYKFGAPTLFYLEKFKQYEDCLTIQHMSEKLSLEDRVILGLKVYPEEWELLSRDREKIIQKIRSMS